MTKPFALQTVLELMQARADDATQALARLIASEQDAKAKLALLQQYRNEYAARFRQMAQNGLSPREWQNYQEFLNRLDDAVSSQSKAVTQQEMNTAAGQARWREQHLKLKAIDTLSERHYAREEAREAKRDQKAQDEFAARLGSDDRYPPR